MITKLDRKTFNKRHRFRKNRRAGQGARCALCDFCAAGYCVHPDRVRRVMLSEPLAPGSDIRMDCFNGSLCDQIRISKPATAIVPFPAINGTYAITLDHVLHTNPDCAYITAYLIDNNLGGFDSNKIVDISGHTHAGPADICELPCCRNLIKIPPGRPDYYLRKLHYDDGFAPPEPPPFWIDDMNIPLGDFSLATELKSYGKIYVSWTEEASRDAVRRIKRIMPTLEKEHISWFHMNKILRLIGWDEVADIINFEYSVRMGCQYCVPCGRKYDDTKKYHFENPTRDGSYPCCPNCRSHLVGWSSFISAMPQ